MRKFSKKRKKAWGFIKASEQGIIYFGILEEGWRPDLSWTMQGRVVLWSFVEDERVGKFSKIKVRCFLNHSRFPRAQPFSVTTEGQTWHWLWSFCNTRKKWSWPIGRVRQWRRRGVDGTEGYLGDGTEGTWSLMSWMRVKGPVEVSGLGSG